MFDPFTLMTIASTATSVVGGLLGASGASQKAQAESQQAAYRAAIARRNAAINRKNSDFALDAGEANALRSGLTTQFTIGKQRVAQAAGGFDVNRGSNLAVQESTQKIGAVDQETIRTEAGRKAYGARQQAEMSDLEAELQDQVGANARAAGQTNVFSTLLGTATSVADKWFRYSQSGGGFGSSGQSTLGHESLHAFEN